MDYAIVLGPIEVWLGGVAVRLRGGKQLGLLAMLLLHPNRPISVERLISSIWEAPPKSAVANIQTYVARLRHTLALEIRGTNAGYLAEIPDERLDLLEFENGIARGRDAIDDNPTSANAEFARAFSLWRGRPATGAHLCGPIPRIIELEELAVTARADWIDLRLDLGMHDHLIPELSGMVEADPLRERTWCQFMLALYRAGRHGEALDIYRKARKIIVAELGIEPSDDLSSLHESLLAGTPPPLRPERATVRYETHWTGVCTLPPDISDFVGRAEELASLGLLLDKDAASPSPGLVVISGPPGVGKSALALRAAHLARPFFPDGQLFVRLRGASIARTPGDVLGELLRTLGVVGDVIPGNTDERAAMFRARVADRAILLILDDADDQEQVLPLLPGTSAGAVIVTSRGPLPALPGSTSLTVDVLPQPDARELLSAVAGRQRSATDPESIQEILHICGRLPLAIRIAGARLASRPGWRPGIHAGRTASSSAILDDFRVGNVNLRASFALSYDAISPIAQETFRLIGLTSMESLADWSIAGLLGRPVAAIDTVVDELLATGLISADECDEAGQTRYRLHDLVLAYAQDLGAAEVSEDQRRAALESLLAESLSRTRLSSDMPPAAPWPSTPAVGSAPVSVPAGWLHAERTNLLCLAISAARCGVYEASARLTVELTPHLHMLALYDDAVRLTTAIISAARAVRDTSAEMRMRLIHTEALTHWHRNDANVPESRKVLEYFVDVGDHHWAALARLVLATGLHFGGDNDQALLLARSAYEELLDMGDVGGCLGALSTRASIHIQRGSHDDVITVCCEAFHLIPDGDAYHSSVFRYIMGVAHQGKGEHSDAAACHAASLRSSKAQEWYRGQQLATRRLAEALHALGQTREAMTLLMESREQAERNGDAHCQALATFTLGQIHRSEGDERTALRQFIRCRDLLGEGLSKVWRDRAIREIARSRTILERA